MEYKDIRPSIKLTKTYTEMLDEISKKKPSLKLLGPTERVQEAIRHWYDSVMSGNENHSLYKGIATDNPFAQDPLDNQPQAIKA